MTHRRIHKSQWIREGNPHWTMHKYERPDEPGRTVGENIFLLLCLSMVVWGIIAFLIYG